MMFLKPVLVTLLIASQIYALSFRSTEEKSVAKDGKPIIYPIKDNIVYPIKDNIVYPIKDNIVYPVGKKKKINKVVSKPKKDDVAADEIDSVFATVNSKANSSNVEEIAEEKKVKMQESRENSKVMNLEK